MSRIKAKVLSKDGDIFTVQIFEENLLVSEMIEIFRGIPITEKQKRLYFSFLTWCIKHGMREKGYDNNTELHKAIKAMFLDVYGYDEGIFTILERGSLKDMDTKEVTDFMELLRRWFLVKHRIDSTPFWELMKKEDEACTNN